VDERGLPIAAVTAGLAGDGLVTDCISDTASWWTPQRHADRREGLLLRGRIKAGLRTYFETEGFVEVEPGALQVSPGNEAHLHGFATEFRTDVGARRPLYLHTSPEFAMKKLLAAGETRIFAFAPVFRNRETGPRHAPEFTMLEWYRAREDYGRVADDCLNIMRIAAKTAGLQPWQFGGRTVAPFGIPKRLTVAHAFRTFAGIDLLATLVGSKADRDALAKQVVAAGVRVATDDTWSDLFSRVLVERVEPALAALPVAVFLMEYPTHEAALARATSHDARVAERFEMYVAGLELANCFGELTDAGEQRRRFESEMAEKQRVYGERYPLDEDFLTALAVMPPASGGALGFDRLVMLAAGASHIAQVQWTPFEGL
jgi:elongation factor P--(R)-beta-lysine ligase